MAREGVDAGDVDVPDPGVPPHRRRDDQVLVRDAAQRLDPPLSFEVGSLAEIGPEPEVGGETDVILSRDIMLPTTRQQPNRRRRFQVSTAVDVSAGLGITLGINYAQQAPT